MSIVIRMAAVAGANYGSDNANIGEAVLCSNADEVTVCTALTDVAIGIIVDAEDATAGWVDVCIDGLCFARAGAALVFTTDTVHWGQCAADGRIDPYTAVADTIHTSQHLALGFWLPNRINDIADGDLAEFCVRRQVRIDTQHQT